MATLSLASLLVPFFQQDLLTSGYRVTFWSFSQYFKLFHYRYIYCDDLWSVMFIVTIVIVSAFLINRVFFN